MGPEPTVPPRHAFKSNETVEGYPRPIQSQNEEVRVDDQQEETVSDEPSKTDNIACEDIAPAAQDTEDQPEEITEEATEDNISDTKISTSEITNPDPDRENNPENRENQKNLDQIKTESALSVAPSVNDTEL